MKANLALEITRACSKIPLEVSRIIYHVVRRCLNGHSDVTVILSAYEASKMRELGYTVIHRDGNNYVIDWA